MKIETSISSPATYFQSYQLKVAPQSFEAFEYGAKQAEVFSMEAGNLLGKILNDGLHHV